MGERWRNWYRYEGLCLKRTWDRTWPGFTLWLAPNAAIPFVLAALLYGLVQGAESMTDYVIAGLCGTAATAAWGGAKFLWYYVTTPALVHAEQVEEIERLKEDLWGTTSDTLQQWLSLGDLELWQAASLWAGKAPKREFEGDPEIALAFEKLKRAIYEKRLIANLSSIERSFLTHQELMGGREVVTKSTKISVKNLRAFAGSPGQRAALFQEHGKPLSLCSLSIDTRLTKGSQHSDYKGNVTEFLVVVRAHSRLSNVRIYARLYGMESDWSDAVVYWAAADEELKIGEIAALRADEVLDIPLGSRDGDVNSPLVVLGKTFERANNYWPYLRVDLRAIADEGATEESLAILSPGYVFNGVLRTEMVPLSKKAVSLIELPSRQSQSDTARGKQR